MVFGFTELLILVSAIAAVVMTVSMISGTSKWISGFIVFFVLMLVADVSLNDFSAALSDSTIRNRWPVPAVESDEGMEACYDLEGCVCEHYFGLGRCFTYESTCGRAVNNVAYLEEVQPTLVQQYAIPVKCYLSSFFGTGNQPCVFTYDPNRCGEEGLSEDVKSERGREFALAGGFMCQPMQPWQCFIIFGVLPIMILYLFLSDILSMGFFSPQLRQLIAIGVSVVSVFSGTFMDFVIEIVKITNLGAGPAFLSTILVLGLISTVTKFISAGTHESADARLGAYESGAAKEVMGMKK